MKILIKLLHTLLRIIILSTVTLITILFYSLVIGPIGIIVYMILSWVILMYGNIG